MNVENIKKTENENSLSSENSEEVYTIPNEAGCSAEFPQGCIWGE